MVIVSPIDYRYGRKEVKEIFSEEGRLKYLLKVESEISRTEAELGLIPKSAAEIISEKAKTEYVKLDRVKEIESEISHDIMAVVKELSNISGDAGKYVHLGATSNDINDTATALQIKDFLAFFEEDFLKLEKTLYLLAKTHKDTPMIGRTHGQHALPITFGLKVSVFLSEIMRHHERIVEAKKRILVGKFMGAVGTGAALGKKTLEVQENLMQSLGLGIEEGPTQIVNRDRYVEYVSIIAGIATSLEKFATEIRNLQRPEIDEVQEPFDEEKQVGSSTMAQKMNPIISENVCSLARIIRGFLTPMHESAILWHERDLTNSASERFIIPYVSILIDDIMLKTNYVFANLKVNKDRMLRNLMMNDLIMGEAYIMFLVSKGYSRQDAHEIVRKSSMEARKNKTRLIDEVRKITNLNIPEANPLDYIGNSIEIVDKILEIYESHSNKYHSN